MNARSIMNSDEWLIGNIEFWTDDWLVALRILHGWSTGNIMNSEPTTDLEASRILNGWSIGSIDFWTDDRQEALQVLNELSTGSIMNSERMIDWKHYN